MVKCLVSVKKDDGSRKIYEGIFRSSMEAWFDAAEKFDNAQITVMVTK